MNKNQYVDKMKGLIFDNRYKIEECIGTGGMADVYKGKDLLLERTVAIKVLHQSFACDSGFVDRFKREAQAAGKLSHPNIVNMYDVGFDQGYHYIIMEYVDGETLKKYIQREGRLSIDSAVKIAIAIGEGLEQAHAMGIVHCDIKPHNILITPTGRVKVTDFGIARAINSSATLMYTTSVMGSVHYLSPEQAGGKAVDGSTDIYSLGVVLYEMLTGRVPYEGETAISIAIKHVKEKLTPPTRYNRNIPPTLESVMVKALEKEPSRRFTTISEFILNLRLSQGIVSTKGSAVAPYDFATQSIPTIQTEHRESSRLTMGGTYHEKGERFLSYLNNLPTKFIVLGCVGIFLVAFLMAFLSYGSFWSSATVVVPNVVGKQVSVAKNILDDKHLRASISEVHNQTIPAGQVISMNPEAGSEVKEQRLINLVVSKGPGDLKVPDLKGLSIEKAKTKLNELGLVLGKISTAESKEVEEGAVLAQSPAANIQINKGSMVDITINKKVSKQVAIPNVVGKTLKEARDTLIAANLSVSLVNGSIADDSVVTAQQPGAGGTTEEGSEFTLTTEEKKEEKKDNKSEGNVTKGTIDITVPEGNKGQTVKILVIDDNGRRVIHEKAHNPGDRIVKDIRGTGSVRIQVYLNNALVQDQSL